MTPGCKYILHYSRSISLWWDSRYVTGKKRKADDGRRTEIRENHRWAYLSSSWLQFTVSFMWWRPNTKTSVCHWLGARWMPWKLQCCVAFPWPLKTKCRPFWDNFSPRMILPGFSSLLVSSFFGRCSSSDIIGSLFFPSKSSFSSFMFFGPIREKIYSSLWEKDSKYPQDKKKRQKLWH